MEKAGKFGGIHQILTLCDCQGEFLVWPKKRSILSLPRAEKSKGGSTRHFLLTQLTYCIVIFITLFKNEIIFLNCLGDNNLIIY